MAVPSIPQSFFVQTGNRQAYLSWNLVAGATSYNIQRSTDGFTFTTLGTASVPSYSDTSVTVGTQYWYQVAAVNSSGTGAYAGGSLYSVVPSPNGELSLSELRLRCQQRADMLNSKFIKLDEWNFMINNSLTELYELLITTYEDYFVASPATLVTDGSSYQYALPDGVTTFQHDNGNSFVAPPLFKLIGVDLGVSSGSQAYATMRKFNFIDRNRYLYPNSGGTVYGVFNLRYRQLGDNIQFSPTPSANQKIRLWYAQKMPQLLADTDITITGISGWLEYVVIDVAIKAKDKQELDNASLQVSKAGMIKRIEDSAPNRDAGQPDTISDVRGGTGGFDNGWGSGPFGGF